MPQPIRNSFSYERAFSNELRNLLDTTIQEIIRDTFPSTIIEPEIFFLGALSNEDCMLYKVLNGHLTSIGIQEIYDELFKEISDLRGAISVRPGLTVEYSKDMRSFFLNAYTVMKEMHCNTITSDHVLLAIYKCDILDEKSPLYNFKKSLINEGFTNEIAIDLSKKMHETAAAIVSPTFDEDKMAEKIQELTKMMESNMPAARNITILQNADTGEISILGDTNDINDIKNIINSSEFGKMIGFDDAQFMELPNSNGNKDSAKKDNSKKASKSTIPFCTNLNVSAEKGNIDPLVGRKEEVNSIIKVFNRRRSNNVVLVGESGVGKTAIVEGLAYMIVNGIAPMAIKDCEVLKFNPGSAMAGTQYRGTFEERINTLTKELKGRKNIILFIDDIHRILNDRQKTDYDFSGMLSDIFNDSYIKVIATTTQKGFHNGFESDAELSRKFQKIAVDAPTFKECYEIVDSTKQYYEKFHGVKYTEDAVTACIKLADRYITDRNLPTSAIDILDEAGADKKMGLADTKKLEEYKIALSEYKKEKDELIKDDNIEATKDIDTKIDGIRLRMAEEEEKIEEQVKNADKSISETDIYKTVAEHTKIPIQKINVSEKKLLAKVDEVLKKDIIGQDDAIEIVTRAIKRNKVGLYPSNRPILSCMCIGNTGCGKTLLAKKLAQEVFGDEKYLIRFDMSEYSDKTAVNKLIGASAGYVGYSEGGLLTEKVKNNKYAVVLIDELEKANDEIFNLFLQILDEGTLTDNTGQKVDFKNTILILTSNVGAKRAADEKGIGFVVNDGANKKDIIEKELKKKFAPEFINRLDEIVYFNDLTDDNLKDIINLELNKLTKRIENIGFTISYEPEVTEYIFKVIEPEREYGARPILRAIQKEIENKVTDVILENDAENGVLKVTVKENNIDIELKQN